MHQGEISRISSYDPLDLFSGEPKRCQHAILCLLDNPQNNFKAFVNGKAVPIEELIEQLQDSFDLPGEAQNRTLLADIMTEILQRSGQLPTSSCVIYILQYLLRRT